MDIAEMLGSDLTYKSIIVSAQDGGLRPAVMEITVEKGIDVSFYLG